MNQPVLYGSLMEKEAEHFFSDLKAGVNGIRQNIGTFNPLASPLKYIGRAYDGFTKGVSGNVASRELAPMEQKGFQFKKDSYGVPQDIDIGGTLQNFGGRALDFLGQYKTPLLTGAGLLGGGYLLNKALTPSNPKPQFGPTQPYLAGQQPYIAAPRAFQKAAGLGLSPLAIASPQGVADAVVNGISMPSLGFGQDDDKPTHQQKPYQPKIDSPNPKLQKMMEDPRMREYITQLVMQSHPPSY